MDTFEWALCNIKILFRLETMDTFLFGQNQNVKLILEYTVKAMVRGLPKKKVKFAITQNLSHCFLLCIWLQFDFKI